MNVDEALRRIEQLLDEAADALRVPPVSRDAALIAIGRARGVASTARENLS